MNDLSWKSRRNRDELSRLAKALAAVDLAIRNDRVLNRRMASTIRHVQLRSAAQISLSDALNELSLAAQSIGLGMSSPRANEREHYMQKAQARMIKVAGTLEPRSMGVATFEGESLVLMLRLITVDFLEATGMSHKDAVDTLIPLGESITKHAPRTTEIPIVTPDAPPSHTPANGAGVRDDGRMNKLHTRSINIMLQENEKESLSLPPGDPDADLRVN